MRKDKRPRKGRVNPKSIANLMPPPKKGEVRNPLGINNPVQTKMRALSMPDIAEIGTLILDQNVADLQAIVDDARGPDKTGNPDSKHSALKVWMATIAMRGIAKGDHYALDTILNRVVGRVATRIEPVRPTGEEDVLPPPVVQAAILDDILSPDERRAEIKRYQDMLADVADKGIQAAQAVDIDRAEHAKEAEEALEVESHEVLEPAIDEDLKADLAEDAPTVMDYLGDE